MTHWSRSIPVRTVYRIPLCSIATCCTQIRNLAMLCGQPGDAPNLVNKPTFAGMKRLDASVISSAHGAPYYGSSTCRSTKSRRSGGRSQGGRRALHLDAQARSIGDRSSDETPMQAARLYQLVENGLINLDDVLRDRLAVVKAQRDRAKGAPDRAKEHSASNPNRSAVDRALQPHGEGELHNWLGALPESLLAAIATIEVDDRQVRMQGSNDVLEKAILASYNAPSQCSQTGI